MTYETSKDSKEKTFDTMSFTFDSISAKAPSVIEYLYLIKERKSLYKSIQHYSQTTHELTAGVVMFDAIPLSLLEISANVSSKSTSSRPLALISLVRMSM